MCRHTDFNTVKGIKLYLALHFFHPALCDVFKALQHDAYFFDIFGVLHCSSGNKHYCKFIFFAVLIVLKTKVPL